VAPVLSVLFVVAASASAAPDAPILAGTPHTVRYPAADKFPLNVSLELPKPLQEATLDVRYLVTRATVPLGMQLAHNAEGLARHLFANVRLAAADDPASGVDAVLAPRLAYVQHLPGPVFSAAPRPPVLVIGLDWTLKATDGAVIWKETVRTELNEPYPRFPRNAADEFAAAQEWIRRALDKAFIAAFLSISDAEPIAAWRPTRALK
jgi:hypothetical protein